jgi:hypothetical protein
MVALSEPVHVPDIFATDLSAIVEVGEGNYRLVWSVQRAALGTLIPQEQIIVCNLVVPRAVLDRWDATRRSGRWAHHGATPAGEAPPRGDGDGAG